MFTCIHADYVEITSKKQLLRNRITETIVEMLVILVCFGLMVFGKCFPLWVGILCTSLMLYFLNWARWKKNLDILSLSNKPVEQVIGELPEK